MSADLATIYALRTDLALQIARHIARTGQTQVALAARLEVPQPTLSKIANGQVDGLSLELLLRIAVRAGLPVVLQTGADPSEAGVHRSGERLRGRTHPSGLDEHARSASADGVSRLSPEQRLEAQLQHGELMLEFQRSGGRGAARRLRTKSDGRA